MANEQSGADGVRYVFTLVHGTWAKWPWEKIATWTRPDSTLLQSLRRKFGDRTQFFSFEWNGRNSHNARRRASEKLKDELKERVDQHKTARHYLICHSHGGNVALQALAGSGIEKDISGVVCLATPFLVARKRDLGRDRRKQFSAALLSIIFLTIYVVETLLSDWSWLGRFAISLLANGVVIGVLAVAVWSWSNFAEKLRMDLSAIRPDQDKVLIVRSPADEASGALVFFQFISKLTAHVYVRATSLIYWYERKAEVWSRQKRKMLVVAAAALFALIGLSVAAFHVKQTAGIGWMFHSVLAAGLLTTVAMAEIAHFILGWRSTTMTVFRVAVSLVVWPVIVLLSLLLLFFGWEVAVANILLDVTVENSPLGSWTVHLIEAPTADELGSDMAPLTHSVYDNPRALALVSDWISSRERHNYIKGI